MTWRYIPYTTIAMAVTVRHESKGYDGVYKEFPLYLPFVCLVCRHPHHWRFWVPGFISNSKCCRATINHCILNVHCNSRMKGDHQITSLYTFTFYYHKWNMMPEMLPTYKYTHVDFH